MATAPSPNDLTRQQLDELDALLQRMLSVPMPAETPAPGTTARAAFEAAPAISDPPLPPSWRVDPPAAPRPTSFPTPPVAKSPAPPVDPPSSVSLKLDVPAPAPATPQAAPPVAKPQAVPPAAPAAPVIAPPVAKPQMASVTAPTSAPAPATPQAVPAPKPSAKLTPAPAAPPTPFFFLPFVALNALFDFVCGLFGPPGRVLRSGFFKTLYGLIGLGLLVYTAAHVAQTQGLVSLPIQLPWPPQR